MTKKQKRTAALREWKHKNKIRFTGLDEEYVKTIGTRIKDLHDSIETSKQEIGVLLLDVYQNRFRDNARAFELWAAELGCVSLQARHWELMIAVATSEIFSPDQIDRLNEIRSRGIKS